MPEYSDVVEDVIEALVHGEGGSSVDGLTVQRRDDGTILADFGDPTHYFVIAKSLGSPNRHFLRWRNWHHRQPAEAGSRWLRDDGRMPVESVKRLEESIARGQAACVGRTPIGLGHQDASEDQGTFGTDDAIGFDPFPVLRAMHAAGVRVVVMGQVAGIMHGSMEMTGDLDLLWTGEPSEAELLADAFRELGAALTNDNGVELACEGQALRVPKIRFRTGTASGDCCTPHLPWGRLPINEYIVTASVAEADDGTVIRYVNRNALQDMRLAVGRAKDLRRFAELSVGIEHG